MKMICLMKINIIETTVEKEQVEKVNHKKRKYLQNLSKYSSIRTG
jgi:hypothetical protein